MNTFPATVLQAMPPKGHQILPNALVVPSAMAGFSNNNFLHSFWLNQTYLVTTTPL
jgi:hypothetical protein